MAERETEFDFSKQSRKEKNEFNWLKLVEPTLNFTKRHKKLLMLGIGVFVVFQGIVYISSDSPQQAKTKSIALQTAAINIPAMIEDIDTNKNSYDEIVKYLMSKEYDISTNSMRTMQEHAEKLEALNITYKKSVNEKEEQLKIIAKKLKETNTFSLLTSTEKEVLLDSYANLKAQERNNSAKLDKAIIDATTTDLDERPSDAAKVKELEKTREEIKKEVTEIKKRGLKR